MIRAVGIRIVCLASIGVIMRRANDTWPQRIYPS